MDARPTPRRTIPLEQMKVESPCPRAWADMTPAGEGDRSRFCAHCNLHVHNLSALTRDEAQRLICESAGRLCVAYLPSAEGTVTTLEYHQPSRPRYRWRIVAALSTVAAVAGTAVGAIFQRPKPAPPPAILGAMVAPRAMVPGMLMPPPPPTTVGEPPAGCE